MTNIFEGSSKQAQCVRIWDEQLRSSEWVDTDIFAQILNFSNISWEEENGYKKAIKKAKKDIANALRLQGMNLREQHCKTDKRKVLIAYPEYNKDPLHNIRIMAVINTALQSSCALRLTYTAFYSKSTEQIFHPHYTRIYNGLQYVYGVYDNEKENKGLPFVALPVDRIDCAKLTREFDYRKGNAESYEKKMSDIIGASPNFKKTQIINVILRTYHPTIHNLLLYKPFHHSIREIKRCTHTEPGELSIYVQETKELVNWILYYGTRLEVISPEHLRAHIEGIIKKMAFRYKK